MRWFALILCFGLFGCGADAPENPAAQAAFERRVQTGHPTIIASVEEDGRVSSFARAAQNKNVETWIGGDGVSLSFRHGLLTTTRGFGWDLMTTDNAESVALVRQRQIGTAIRIHRYLNGEGHLIARSFVCDVRSRGKRDIEISPETVQTVLVEEACTGTDDSFRNLYWIDTRNHTILQSRQWVGPEIGALALRLTKR
ncbi:YjbF family lipoprotein [Aliiroseovarius sp. YM-037]|uniref:YjbF family lipoprotein n=1 Tax=Aliiroseovarius sp. YM-037 TaxID=3341728 RepID=UPI003A7F90FF